MTEKKEAPTMSKDKLQYLLNFYETLEAIVRHAEIHSAMEKTKVFPLDLDIGTLTGQVEDWPIGSTSIELEEWEYRKVKAARLYYQLE